MQKIFVMYKLNAGVSLDEYVQWSQGVDQPITSNHPPCIRFEAYAIEGAREGVPIYDIIEEIEVDSWSAWQGVPDSPGKRKVAETFPKYADLATRQVVYGARIRPAAEWRR